MKQSENWQKCFTPSKPQNTPKRIERTFNINTLHKWSRYLNSVSVKNRLSGKIMEPTTLYKKSTFSDKR